MSQDIPSKNKEVVTRFLEDVFSQGYAHMVGEFIRPDAVDHNAIIFEQPEGQGGVEEGIRMFLQAFPDFRLEAEQLIAEGDLVAVRLHMSGTNTGEYRGLPEPTERHASWDAMAFFRLSEGKIAEIWGVADRMAMLTELGILPDIG